MLYLGHQCRFMLFFEGLRLSWSIFNISYHPLLEPEQFAVVSSWTGFQAEQLVVILQMLDANAGRV